MLMAAISELMGKDADEDIEVKAGRVLNSRNMLKIQNAFNLLQEVLSAGGVDSDLQAKSFDYTETETMTISSDKRSLYELKDLLNPVLDYYEIKSEVTEEGVKIDLTDLEDDAFDALINVMDVL